MLCRRGSRKRGTDPNHPQYMKALVKSHAVNLTLSNMDATMSTRQRDDSAKKYATAHIKAHQTGEKKLYTSSMLLDLQVSLDTAAVLHSHKSVVSPVTSQTPEHQQRI